MSEPLEPLASAETYLTALQREQAELKSVSDRVRELAVAARAAGATWRQIGDAMGTSFQAAQQRFGQV